MESSIATPDWLTLRGGELRRGLDDFTWLVLLGDDHEYTLVVAPARGHFSCAVTQTNNGRRLDKGTVFPTSDAALHGGLNELREALGW